MRTYKVELDHWTHRETIVATSEHQARCIIDRYMVERGDGNWARAILKTDSGRPLRTFKRYPRS